MPPYISDVRTKVEARTSSRAVCGATVLLLVSSTTIHTLCSMQSSMLQSVVAAAEYFPAMQGVQFTFPALVLYVPEVQIAQALPSWAKPALHWQSVTAELPAVALE